MLTCFLKADNEIQAICSIPKFVDRIQILGKSLDIEGLRYFVVENHLNSPQTIYEISLVIPCEKNRIQDIQDRTYQLLDVNDPFVRKARGSIEPHVDTIQRLIKNYDGLGDVYVFGIVNYELESIGNFTRIRCCFDCGLNPGQKAAIRLKYRIKNFMRKSQRNARELEIHYFDETHKMTSTAHSVCTIQKQVPVLMWYGQDRPADDIPAKGGFDIFVRCPFNYNLLANIPYHSETISNTNNEGIQDQDQKIYNWKLRRLKSGNNSEVLCGSGAIQINSIIEKPITMGTQWIFLGLSLIGALIISILVAIFLK